MSTPKIILICPAARPAVAALAIKQPLVLAPFAGLSVIEHALHQLAADGAKEITILASDRPEAIRAAAGRGEQWGVKLQVVAADREPDPAAVRQAQPPGAEAADVRTLERLPQLPDHPLWDSYEAWFAAQVALLPDSAEKLLGMREIAPEVYAGLRSQVAGDARLQGPCWIGAGVRIGAGAVIGPEVIIGDGSFVDDGAEVAHSVVAPQTYVGAHTELRHSFAQGNALLSLRSGSRTTITDRFLLGDLASGGRTAAEAGPGEKTGGGIRGLLDRGRRILRKLVAETGAEVKSAPADGGPEAPGPKENARPADD